MNEQSSVLYRYLWLLALCSLPYNALLTVDLFTHPVAPEFFFNSVGFRLVIGFIIAPLTLAIAFLIIRRKPGNVVGPMLVLWGTSVATWALRSNIDITTMAVLSNITSVGWSVVMFLGFFFPTGRMMPERWHPLLSWIVIGAISATFLATPLSDTLSFLREEHPNPLYFPMLAPFSTFINLLIGLPIVLLPVMVYSIYRRYKQSNVVQRQQLKWLAFSFLIFLLLTPVTLILSNMGGTLAETAGLLVNGWLYMFPAVTIGNAILRHRLYDIDIIIRRTLVYSILTGILAVIYFGGVIVVQQLLRPLTESSDLAIVVSTLLIAALFSPLRRRIQSTIDRRFFRRKYDAEQTLARFNQTLRDEVDIETLKAELVGVVQETMQPTKIALWMKETK
jgi:hypothetical protein